MQTRIARVPRIICQHIIDAKAKQYWAYNHPAKSREFQPGDIVLLLLLTTNYKFLTHWQGLYTVMERMCLVNYFLQLYYVNLLKRWIEPFPSLSRFASVPAGQPGLTLIQQEEDLTPA